MRLRLNPTIIVRICSVLAGIILLHLIGVYLYSGGKFEGVKGGSISIGIVDTAPSPMNPFQFGKDDSVDFVYRFLFRGLIRYDITRGVYTANLASCDIGDVSLIRCTLGPDARWSDGTPVQAEDVVATINTFRTSSPDEEVRLLLSSVTAKVTGSGSVEIKSPSKSQKILEVLTYPIVRTDVIELIRSGRIGQNTYVTSGPFVLGEIAEDKAYGFNRITLIRNDKYPENTWLDKIHFKFFKDIASLQRSAEALTIIIPPKRNENMDFGPRFEAYTYTNFEYFSVFFNTRTLQKPIRNSLHWQLGNTLNEFSHPDSRSIQSIFDTGQILPDTTLKNFADVMREMGYRKKSEIIRSIESESSVVSGEPKFDTATYWTNGSNLKTLLIADPAGELILRGNVPGSTQSVSINGYTLKEFAAGNTSFVYKVTTASGTLAPGKNTYTLTLDQGEGKTLSEVLTLYWGTDEAALAPYKQELKDAYNMTQNTPALIAERDAKKAETLQKVGALSDEFYYNKDLQAFNLKVIYVTGPLSTEPYASIVEKSLRLLGIQATLTPYTPKELQTMITSGKKEYDLLMLGVSASNNIANIGQMFSSSPSGSGINFSGYSSKSLDSLFGELRSNVDSERAMALETEITKIFNTESVFFPIASPYHKIYIDRNIKGIVEIDTLPSIPSFYHVLKSSSIKERYILSLQGKSITGFFGWLFSQF